LYYSFVPDSLFSDKIHLNQKGVNAFNNKLMETLEKIMIITDRDFHHEISVASSPGQLIILPVNFAE